jgi:predicted acylesterase/phospholipase RssA
MTKSKLKIVNISGGGTKGAGIAGQLTTLMEEYDYKPDIITGVSYGAMAIIPTLLKKYKELKEITLSITQKKIFSVPPVNSKGKLTWQAYFRFFLSQIKKNVDSLGEQKNLTELFKTLVTPSEFYTLIQSLDCPQMYVAIVNINSGQLEVIRLNELNYENMVKVVIASASIPVYTSLVQIGNKRYADGGLGNHICNWYMLEKYGENISEMYNLYSRDEAASILDNIKDRYTIKNILGQSIDILIKNHSKTLQAATDFKCSVFGIKNINVFLPNILTHFYDTQNLDKLYEAGVTNMRKSYGGRTD